MKLPLHNFTKFFLLFILIILAICLSTSSSTAQVVPQSTYQIYFPLVVQHNHPIDQGLGVQIEGAYLQERDQYLAPGSFVKISVNWNTTEPEPGVYNWPPILDGLDGYPLLVNVKNAPPWARLGGPTAPECGGVAPDHYSDYTTLILRLLNNHPNIRAVELWNEPDLIPDSPEAQSFYGCIGDGEVYAQLVCAVTPILHEAYPGVIVIAGALGNPQDITFLANFANSCQAEDIISFHHHEKFWSSGKPNSHPDTWQAGRIANTVGILTNKPVWLTETAIICPDIPCPESDFEQIQQQYATWLLEQPIRVKVWYTLADNSWPNYQTDLCFLGYCRPAWTVYQNSWK